MRREERSVEVSGAGDVEHEDGPAGTHPGVSKKIQQMIADLRSNDGHRRRRAREGLLGIGRPAVPALIELLDDPLRLIRWEACKTLGSIMDPSTAGALSRKLNDESMEVRWLAAEGLIALKEAALVSVLETLKRNSGSIFVREGVHHVLHALERERRLNQETLAVLESVRFLEPHIYAAVAAEKALASLRGAAGRQS